jgi:hypothetical protein
MYLYETRPDFFDFYGIPLLRGRRFEPTDTADVAIVGERMAAALWPGGDPLGQTMSLEQGPTFHVVGVAKEITLPSLLNRVELPEIYVPYSGRRSVVSIGWRCGRVCPDRSTVAARVREADPKARPLDVSSLEQRFARHLARPRAAAELGATFAGIGLVTSGAGLFAVLSYAIGRRRREFGIRSALGATPASLHRGVTRDALSLAAVGLAAGALAAWTLGRALSSAMYGVSATDPAAWLAMLVIVAGTTLVAAWRPARQAARVDPVALLREE